MVGKKVSDGEIIPVAVPNLAGKEAEYLSEAVSSGWVGPDGPFVERFEDMVAKASGRKWAIATITGSAAIHASMIALFGPTAHNIEVPQYAFPAAQNLLRLHHWSVAEKPGGTDHDLAIYSWKERSFADCAPAIGNRKETGATVDCYSFAANKIVTCGHGGAICGDEDRFYYLLRDMIHQHTANLGPFNYRMANVNAAVGCAQMERLEELREAKRKIWERYKHAGLPMMERGPSRWMATIPEKEAFKDFVASERGFDIRREPFGTSLPCSTHLTEKDQDKVIKYVKSIL